MVGENLEYGIRARDESGPAAESFLSRWTGEDGVWGRFRAAVAGATLFAAQALDDVADRAARVRRSVQRATGTTGDEQEDALADLLGIGAQEGDAIAAIEAAAGPGQALGVGLGDRQLLATLAGLSAVGGSPTGALQALQGFNVPAGDVGATLDVAFGTSAAQGVDAATISAGLRNYGPVLSALGLNVLESAAFIADLATQGIDISRVSPALNRFIRDASAAGQAPREVATGAFEALRRADEVDAAALGQELFGAEGGLRLTQAIRSGQVGFGEQLIPSDLTNVLTLASQINPTDRELAAGLAAGAGVQGGIFGNITSALVGGAGQAPLVGGLVQSAAGEAARLAGAGLDERTLAQSQRVIELLDEIARGVSNLNRADAYATWLAQRQADEGRLQE